MIDFQLNTSRPHYNRLDDYFGLWMMEESRFSPVLQHIAAIDLSAHVAAHRRDEDHARARSSEPARSGAIAVIPISGTLMKAESSLMDSTSSVYARMQIRAALRNPDISGILLLIDSPGGTVAGTADLADEVFRANMVKPVHAFIEDLGASAAYWVASQAGFVSINRTGAAGGIGVFGAVVDRSRQFENLGVHVYTVKAGAYKGMGQPGTPVTKEELDIRQAAVDTYYGQFVQAVSAGRKITTDRAQGLADGRLHIGQQAVSLGLVDAVSTLDDAVARLQSQIAKPKGTVAVTTNTPIESSVATSSGGQPTSLGTQQLLAAAAPLKPIAATLAELKAACPNAPAEFLMAQLEGNATVESAQKAFILQLQQQNTQSAGATTGAAVPGNTVNLAAAGTGRTSVANDAGEDFCSLVDDLVTAGMERQKAVAAVARKHPAAHQAFLMGSQKSKFQRDMLARKASMFAE